jgi:hypothetical protein
MIGPGFATPRSEEGERGSGVSGMKSNEISLSQCDLWFQSRHNQTGLCEGLAVLKWPRDPP